MIPEISRELHRYFDQTWSRVLPEPMKERAFTSARMSSGACSFCACFGAFKVCEDFEATSGSVVFELFENVGLKNQSSRCKIEAFYFTRIAIQIRTKTR